MKILHLSIFITMEGSFDDILTCYKAVIASDLYGIAEKNRRLKLPIVQKALLQSLVSEAKDIFASEPIILSIPVPILVVGDIHGHMLDLLRILKENGLPPETSYLFLGDFIDRGEMSTEVMTLILTLKVLFPTDVFIVRGNHEFGTICDHKGFYDELYNIYNDNTVKDLFLSMFSYIPLAANAQGFALCVHGGIGPSWFFLEQLKDLKRPIEDFDNPLVTEILWSDPTETTEMYEESHRGLGVHFGKTPILNFLQRTGFTYIVRGHQCVNNGCETSLGSRVITVFSASNYCGCDSNKCGVLRLERGETYNITTYPPFQWIRRDEVNFQPLDTMKAEVTTPKKAVSRSRRLGSLDSSITAVRSAMILPKLESGSPSRCERGRKISDAKSIDSLASHKVLPRIIRPMNSGSLSPLVETRPRRFTKPG